MLKMRQAEIAENTTARLLVEGVFVNPNPTSTFYIKNITEEGELRSVFLADHSAPGIARTYSATRAFLVKSDSGPKLVMIDGTMEQYSTAQDSLSVTRFNDFTIDMGSMVGITAPEAPSGFDLNSFDLAALPKDGPAQCRVF